MATLGDFMEDYDRERIAEIDRWETDKPQWIKDKVASEREDDIRRGIRDADGFHVIPEGDEGEEGEDDEDEA